MIHYQVDESEREQPTCCVRLLHEISRCTPNAPRNPVLSLDVFAGYTYYCEYRKLIFQRSGVGHNSLECVRVTGNPVQIWNGPAAVSVYKQVHSENHCNLGLREGARAPERNNTSQKTYLVVCVTSLARAGGYVVIEVSQLNSNGFSLIALLVSLRTLQDSSAKKR